MATREWSMDETIFSLDTFVGAFDTASFSAYPTNNFKFAYIGVPDGCELAGHAAAFNSYWRVCIM